MKDGVMTFICQLAQRKQWKYRRFMFVNIMDPKIHECLRYHSGDELVDKFRDKFISQIGMRIMQRPTI